MPVSFENTTTPHLISPTTAGWAQVTVGAGAWVNSAWYELLAATPAGGAALTGVVVNAKQTIIDNPQSYEVELGIGTAGNEVPIGVCSGSARSVTNYGPQRTFRPLGIPYGAAAGVRVAARLRKSVYSAGNEGVWGIGLGYYTLPVAGLITTTTQQQKTVPAASVGNTFDAANLPVWTSGAWITLTSGLSTAIAVTGIEYNGDTTALFELDLGYGDSTVTVLTTIRNRITGGTSGKGGPANVDFFPPVVGIPASTPIKARFRLDFTTIFSTIWGAKITYLALPL